MSEGRSEGNAMLCHHPEPDLPSMTEDEDGGGSCRE